MPSEGSVTRWIADLHDGKLDPDVKRAQEELWQRYFVRLVGLAKMKLGDAPRAIADEEDVATSALEHFFEGVPMGRFPKLHDRHSLWPLLAKITVHKAIDQRRRALSKKQGGGKIRGDSAIFGKEDQAPDWPMALVDKQLTPETLLDMSERCKRLLDLLSDDYMREIARRRLAGYSNAEIAGQLGVVERTVERRLGIIRDTWAAELDRFIE